MMAASIASAVFRSSVISTMAQFKPYQAAATSRPRRTGNKKSSDLILCSGSRVSRKNAIIATSSGYSTTVLKTSGAMIAVKIPPSAPPKATQK